MLRIILPSLACSAVPYFSTYLINGAIFLKPSLNINCVFRFSVQLLSETFLIRRTIQQDFIKNSNWSSCSYSSQSLTELAFSRQIFEKYSNIKLLENPCSGSRVVPCGRTDITKPIVAFLSFANAPSY
jgi:hypothetical protein